MIIKIINRLFRSDEGARRAAPSSALGVELRHERVDLADDDWGVALGANLHQLVAVAELEGDLRRFGPVTGGLEQPELLRVSEERVGAECVRAVAASAGQ